MLSILEMRAEEEPEELDSEREEPEELDSEREEPEELEELEEARLWETAESSLETRPEEEPEEEEECSPTRDLMS